MRLRNSPFLFKNLSSVFYQYCYHLCTIVCNMVTPEPAPTECDVLRHRSKTSEHNLTQYCRLERGHSQQTPSKSRPGSGDGVDAWFFLWTISPTCAHMFRARDGFLQTVLFFYPTPQRKACCVPGDVDIPICVRVEAPVLSSSVQLRQGF